jgi:hypothetical protein
MFIGLGITAVVSLFSPRMACAILVRVVPRYRDSLPNSLQF